MTVAGLMQGRGVENGFDGAARLAGAGRHIHLAVNGFVVKINAAHHRQNATAHRVQRHQRAVGHAVLGLRGRHRLGGDAFGQPLQRQIEGCGHFQPGAPTVPTPARSHPHQMRANQKAVQFCFNELGKMGCQRGCHIGTGIQAHRLPVDGVSLFWLQIVVAHHQIQHHPLARFGRGKVGEEVQIGGLLGNPRQQCSLGLGEIGSRFAKIDLAGGFRSIGQMAVVGKI